MRTLQRPRRGNWLLAAAVILALFQSAIAQLPAGDEAAPAAAVKQPFDKQLLEPVRKTNRQGLVAADREAFYTLVDAASRPEASRLPLSPAPPDIVSLLESPEAYQGQVMPVEGVARRAVKVAVGDADIQQRFGIDHYYEIDLLVSLGDKRLKFGNRGQPGPVYGSRFPATLIVRRLPAGLTPGDNIRQQVRANAVFFKVWSYPSDYTRPFGQLQAAPLFIAAEPQVVPEAPRAGGAINLIVGLALVLLAALGTVVYWRYWRADRIYSAERKRKLIGREGHPPDFSGLE